MSRLIQYLNFLGVVALAGLCLVQWEQNSQLNKQVNALEIIRLDHLAKVAEQEKTLKANAADLDDFRRNLSKSESALKDSATALAALTVERNRLSQLNDQYKATLNTWQAAVAQRDDELKRVAEQLKKLLDDRNEAVVRFNGLVGNYDAAISELKETRAKLASNH